MYLLKPETPDLAPAVESLLDTVFGASRFDKASYQYRIGVQPVADLSWTAFAGDRLVGSIRYWPILVDPQDGGTATQALLLGPLSIDQEFAGKGIGRALTFKTLELAAGLGYGLVLLVGDIDYYKRFGFVPATPYGFVMPGESRPHRLQVAALRDGLLEPGQVTGGEIRHIHSGEPALLTTAATAKPRRGHRRPANANGRNRLAI
ncbi:GNAT family N-acetyltransferase [Dongia soli]|uniref:N-acetyltransferase n=1 Tax=Dongia soli TaxID=600628 RepID=A0ABU5E8L6_9PROT|nr:N-acetyltransferase [Dongia soli]MDY0882099.1 N-acetyltransferase [Dongia soli]